VRTQDATQIFLNNRQAQNLKPKTIQWYEGELRAFARFCPELPTEPGPIEQFLINLNVSPETKHTCFGALKAFYHFISQRYRLPNPIEQIARPHRPKKLMPTLEPRQIMQLINLASNLRDKTLVTLFADTGGRLDEIRGLRKQDVRDDSIKVDGKTGEREIPISDETRRLLMALIAVDEKGEYVFNSRLGRTLGRHGIYYTIRLLMTKAGIPKPKLGPHRIRHAFGKNYLVSGGDMRSLQKIMGHANITTTEKYAALNLNDVIAKHHRFTPLRAAHAAAQASFLDQPESTPSEESEAIREAEEILERKSR